MDRRRKEESDRHPGLRRESGCRAVGLYRSDRLVIRPRDRGHAVKSFGFRALGGPSQERAHENVSQSQVWFYTR